MNTTAALSRPIALPPLPYAMGALHPVISADTLNFHYGKHHKSYVDTLNKLIGGTEFADLPLDDIVKTAWRQPAHSAIFNNAAQAWNHTFYWNSLRPNGGGEPPSTLKQMMEASFGSVVACKKELTKSAVENFGSGWTWLVEEGGGLKVINTSNANTPLAQGPKPLLTIDLWEHAYYLDYQNRRIGYVNGLLERLANWDFAADNLNKGT